MEPRERGNDSDTFVARIVFYAATFSTILFAIVIWLVLF